MEHHMSVQWHITTDCQNRCKHCYVFDEKTYKNEEYREAFRKDKEAFFERECPELSYQQRQYIIFRYNYLTMMG